MLETPQIPRAALPYWAGVPGMVQELPGEAGNATGVSRTPIRDMWLDSWTLLATICGHLVEHVHKNPAAPKPTHPPTVHMPHPPVPQYHCRTQRVLTPSHVRPAGNWYFMYLSPALLSMYHQWLPGS